MVPAQRRGALVAPDRECAACGRSTCQTQARVRTVLSSVGLKRPFGRYVRYRLALFALGLSALGCSLHSRRPPPPPPEQFIPLDAAIDDYQPGHVVRVRERDGVWFTFDTCPSLDVKKKEIH